MTAGHRVVLDNTVLANFALAGCSELLARLWGDVLCTTPQVMAEYRRGVAKGAVPDGTWEDLAAIELEPDAEPLAESLPSSLGSGERSCLAVVLRLGGILATDDLRARKVAAGKGISVTGTTGILVACVRKELIDLDEGNRLLGAMIEHGYHSPALSLDDFL